MRQTSLALPARVDPPRAPSAAVLGVLWASLSGLAALGVHLALAGHDLTAALPRGPAPRGHVFTEQLSRLNAAGQTVRFGRFSPGDASHDAAIQLGDDFLALPADFEGGDFQQLLVSPDGRRWLAIEAFDTEAMGDVQLVASDDGGRTFVHRGAFVWPTFLASLQSASFDGQNVDLDLALDQPAELARPYWSWLDELRYRVYQGDQDVPLLAPGHYRAHSGNGGRSFGALRLLP